MFRPHIRRLAALAAVSTCVAAASQAALAAPAAQVAEPKDAAEEESAQPSRAPGGPPPPLRISALRMPKKVTGQRGHGRILVGVRLSRAGTVTAQIESLKDGVLRRTVTQERRHPKGRAYLRIDATGDDGFQLSQGVYRITMSATDPRGRLSNELTRNFRLKLTAPRGRFDAYTVPLLPAFRRDNPIGQLIAVVGAGGAAADAGIRRGDIVTRIGPHWITSPGSLARAQRGLLANRVVKVRIIRGGKLIIVKMTPKPDWTARPDFARSLRVAAGRAPNDFAIHYARVSQLIDVGKLQGAKRLKGAWRRSWRMSAPSHYLDGRILLADGRDKPALGAYIRAAKRDPSFAEAFFGQGSALSSLQKRARAVAAFDRAAELDPRNAAARAFAAYVLNGGEDFDAALTRANQAVKLDPLYADGHIPRGIALLGRDQKAAGLQALRRGLLDLDSTSRAERIIDENLEPADP